MIRLWDKKPVLRQYTEKEKNVKILLSVFTACIAGLVSYGDFWLGIAVMLIIVILLLLLGGKIREAVLK